MTPKSLRDPFRSVEEREGVDGSTDNMVGDSRDSSFWWGSSVARDVLYGRLEDGCPKGKTRGSSLPSFDPTHSPEQ